MRTIILPLLLALASAAAAADMAVVHPGVAAASMTADQAKDIFLGRKTTWDDGSKIVVVVSESGPGSEALMRLVGKNMSQYTTGWKKLVFSGKGTMPETAKDDAAALALVAKTPGAIGFAVDAAGDGIKPLPLP